MIKVQLIAAIVLVASVADASAYYYHGRHYPRHAGIGRHGHVIDQGERGIPHGGARDVRSYQTFEAQRPY